MAHFLIGIIEPWEPSPWLPLECGEVQSIRIENTTIFKR